MRRLPLDRSITQWHSSSNTCVPSLLLLSATLHEYRYDACLATVFHQIVLVQVLQIPGIVLRPFPHLAANAATALPSHLVRMALGDRGSLCKLDVPIRPGRLRGLPF